MSAGPTPLVLVGAGGLGRETIAAVRAVNHLEPTWDLLGLLDDREELVGSEVDGVEVLGSTELVAPLVPAGDGQPPAWRDRELRVVLSVGSPRAPGSRGGLAARLGDDIAFAAIVHPTASLAPGTQVGSGSILLAQVVTTAPVHIGRHVVAMPRVVLTHDDVVGDHATLASGATLAGGVVVGEGAYIGAGALVREGLTIGRGAVVGMGAVVTRDVPPGEVWVGNPARRLHTHRSRAFTCGRPA